MPSRPGAWWPSGWWEQQDGSLPVEEHPPACHLVPLRGVTLPSPPFLPSLVSLPSPPLTTLSHLSSSSHADVVWGSSCVWSLFCSPHLYGVFYFFCLASVESVSPRPASPPSAFLSPPPGSSLHPPPACVIGPSWGVSAVFSAWPLAVSPFSRSLVLSVRYWTVVLLFCFVLGVSLLVTIAHECAARRRRRV